MNKITKFATNLFLFLLPLYFFPQVSPALESDRNFFFIIFTLILTAFFILKTLMEKKLKLHIKRVHILLFLLSVLALLSLLISSPNKIEALISPMGVGTIFAVTLFSLLVTEIHPTLTPVLVSSIILSCIAVLSNLGLLTWLPLPYTNLYTFFFSLVISAYAASEIIISVSHQKKKIKSKIILLSIVLLSNLLNLVFSAVKIYPNLNFLFLPYQFGWSILLEMYKNIQFLLFGVGGANFAYAFSLGKPPLINLSPFWNTISNTSSSFFLTLSTEYGVFAAVIFIALFLQTIRPLPAKAYLIPLIITFLILFFFPSDMLLFIFLIFLLSLSGPDTKTIEINLHDFKITISAIFFVIFLLFILVLTIRSYAADIFFRQSLADYSSSSPNPVAAYPSLEKAIALNPYSDRYFAYSSPLSLEIAKNLGQQTPASESAKLQPLFSQAVSHAKKAVGLNPKNSENWAILAYTYKSLTGIVTDSEKNSLEALSQQILLDPNSAQPRLTAGGIMMSLGQYEQANLLFNQAINIKPDWNNAYYNMANLFFTLKNYPRAREELGKSLNFTPPDTDDYRRIKSELDQLNNLLSPPATQSATISATEK